MLPNASGVRVVIRDAGFLSMIANDLQHKFGGISRPFNPELCCVFNDVTYKSIQDGNFRPVLSDAMRRACGEDAVRHLFSEHDATPVPSRLSNEFREPHDE
jgi:hypothetical protein